MAKSYICYSFYYNFFFISKNKLVENIIKTAIKNNTNFICISFIFCIFIPIFALISRFLSNNKLFKQFIKIYLKLRFS